MAQDSLADTFSKVFSNLSDAETVAVYRAISEWAERERHQVELREAEEESSGRGNRVTPSETLVLAEDVLEKLAAEFITHGKRFWYPKAP